jgi:hypothetical protein
LGWGFLSQRSGGRCQGRGSSGGLGGAREAGGHFGWRWDEGAPYHENQEQKA